MGSLSLFFGAFFDALIGTNLFIAGEPFLLAAGYQLHSGIWLGVIMVLLGGFLGDQMSFLVGRSFGRTLRKKILRWLPRTRTTIARCHLLMAQRGSTLLILARLLGPVSWFVPFLAGMEKVRWRRFTLYGTIGLLLGIGQFTLWGWLLACGVERFALLRKIADFLKGNSTAALLSLCCLLTILGVWKYRLIRREKN